MVKVVGMIARADGVECGPMSRFSVTTLPKSARPSNHRRPSVLASQAGGAADERTATLVEAEQAVGRSSNPDALADAESVVVFGDLSECTVARTIEFP